MDKLSKRVGGLEGQAAAYGEAAAIVTEARRPRTREEIGGLLIDLLAAKLEASRAVADAARAAMQSPAWLARQSAEGVATLADYLDRSAFALGDRLAGAATVATQKSEEGSHDEP